MIPFNPTAMISYLRSIVTIGLSRTISEINGDFRRKSHENRQYYPTHCVFNALTEAVPLGIGYRCRGQTKLE